MVCPRVPQRLCGGDCGVARPGIGQAQGGRGGGQDGAKRLRTIYADRQQAWDAVNSEFATELVEEKAHG